jgi:predicted naringenin-chalcone synthase
MSTAFINAIATAVPRHDVHRKFVEYAPRMLRDERAKRLFGRMAERSGIEHRFSALEPDPASGQVDRGGFYAPGRFPGTEARMRRFERDAFPLAEAALHGLDPQDWRRGLSHILVTCCTGFYAPGLDLQIIERFDLDPSIERTVVGFMGCNAAFNGLKLARHIIRSEPRARVLMLNLELCTLHLQETEDLEQLLSFLIFADGCAASLVSADPAGIELGRFAAAIVPDSREQIAWRIGSLGFDMRLSGQVPHAIGRGLPAHLDALLGGRADAVELWAVHPGGRSVLDAVEQTAGLDPGALRASREVLRRYGNMSSATAMFVLEELMRGPAGAGCAMAFGPGITVESLLFRKVDR